MTEVTMVRPDDTVTGETEHQRDEEWEDYLDYCAAAEAIDEALETGEIRPFEDFAKELGI